MQHRFTEATPLRFDHDPDGTAYVEFTDIHTTDTWALTYENLEILAIALETFEQIN